MSRSLQAHRQEAGVESRPRARQFPRIKLDEHKVTPRAHASTACEVHPHLFRKLDKVLAFLVAPRPALQQRPQRKRDEQDLEQTPPRVILVGGLDVAEEDGGAGDPVEEVLEGVEEGGERAEEGEERRRDFCGRWLRGHAGWGGDAENGNGKSARTRRATRHQPLPRSGFATQLRNSPRHVHIVTRWACILP